MILGIDVGGTHTDAVLLENFKVKKKTKVLTNQLHLVSSLIGVMDEILRDEDLAALERVVFSTTLSTNAIVQGKIDRVGMIVASGPGLAPEALRVNDDTRFISGYMSNRGIEVSPVKKGEIAGAASELKASGIRHLGIVGKFSTRNPAHENEIGEFTRSDFQHVSLGHRMSGNLNFRRRIATTYLNASIFDLYNRFVGEILDFAARTGLDGAHLHPQGRRGNLRDPAIGRSPRPDDPLGARGEHHGDPEPCRLLRLRRHRHGHGRHDDGHRPSGRRRSPAGTSRCHHRRPQDAHPRPQDEIRRSRGRQPCPRGQGRTAASGPGGKARRRPSAGPIPPRRMP